jgi:CubicO group peptidase (beta-lactamase class C family)
MTWRAGRTLRGSRSEHQTLEQLIWDRDRLYRRVIATAVRNWENNMIKWIATICLLAAVAIAGPAMASPDAKTFRKQVNRFVEAEINAQKVPGMAIAVLHKGKVVIARGYGRATVEHEVAVTNTTIFQSGSLGKMFTAAAVMTQVEQGRMNLDDSISKYLPEAPSSWRSITIRHLLTHTSGIPDFNPDIDFRRDYTEDELAKAAYPLSLEFVPGSRWRYSNTGYLLLGIVVKKATGQSYLDILDMEVFKPLGMRTARGISESDIVPHRASGYKLVNDALKNQDWVSPTMNSTADGSLYLSLDDMIAWAQGVERGKVLSPAAWQQVLAPVRLNSGSSYPYGFGWRIAEADGKAVYYHGGAWQGFRTYFSRYLGDDLTIILLTNSANTKLETIVDGIAGLWNPALVKPAARPIPEPAIDRRVSALIELLRNGSLRQQDVVLAPRGYVEFANQHFGPLLKQLGPVTKLELMKRRILGDDVAYNYRASFGDRNTSIELIIAPGDEVSSLIISE